MTNQTPNTNPLTHEKPGDVRHVPSRGPGERGIPHTRDKHQPQIDRQGGESTQTPQEQNRPDHQRK